MFRIIPLHADGITDGAKAFWSCFSCFLYFALLFWNYFWQHQVKFYAKYIKKFKIKWYFSPLFSSYACGNSPKPGTRATKKKWLFVNAKNISFILCYIHPYIKNYKQKCNFVLYNLQLIKASFHSHIMCMNRMHDISRIW